MSKSLETISGMITATKVCNQISCPKFQVLCSHFSEVDELLNEHWAKPVWREIWENISTQTCVECNSMYHRINRTFAVNPIWYILSGLVLRLARLALINNLSNLRMTILEKISSRLQDMTSHLPFLVDQCEDMPWWSKRVAVSQEIWDRLLQGAETLCSPSAICVALSRSVHWYSLFYLDVLSIILFSNFVSGDFALTNLNMKVWLHCFGALAVGSANARGQDSTVCVASGTSTWAVIVGIFLEMSKNC